MNKLSPSYPIKRAVIRDAALPFAPTYEASERKERLIVTSRYLCSYGVYPDNTARKNIINEICEKYKFVHHRFAGKSVLGRSIDVLHVGSGKSEVLYCGGFHGSEYQTVLALLKFFEECCRSMQTGTPVGEYQIDNFLPMRGLTVVPCVNPDGVEIALRGAASAGRFEGFVNEVCADTSRWQANARGVDINHNFNAGWHSLKALEIKNNIKRPAPTRYGGSRPESEPETRAITSLCIGKDFERVLALHSQGREIYCSFGKHTPVLSYRLASILSQASGYNIAFPEEIATGGGFKDWFIEKFRKPGITVEMGLGENPLPLESFEPEYKILRKILCLGVMF